MHKGVIVEGTYPSREQVYQAYETIMKAMDALNQPEPLKHLQRLRLKGSLGVVGVLIIGDVQQNYIRQKFSFAPSLRLSLPRYRFTIVNQDGGGSSFETEEELLRVWELILEAEVGGSNPSYAKQNASPLAGTASSPLQGSTLRDATAKSGYPKQSYKV